MTKAKEVKETPYYIKVTLEDGGSFFWKIKEGLVRTKAEATPYPNPTWILSTVEAMEALQCHLGRKYEIVH